MAQSNERTQMSLTKSSATAFDLSQRIARTHVSQPAAAEGCPEDTPTTIRGDEGAKRGRPEPDSMAPRLRTFFVSPEIALRVRQQVLREPGRRQRAGVASRHDPVKISGLICDLVRLWMSRRDLLDKDYDSLVFGSQEYVRDSRHPKRAKLVAYMTDDFYMDFRAACIDEQERRGYDGMPAERVSSASAIVRGLLLYWLEHRDVLDETLRKRRDGQQDESRPGQAKG